MTIFEVAEKIWEFRDWIWYVLTISITGYTTAKSFISGLPIYLVIPLGLFTAASCLWIAIGVKTAPEILLSSRRRARSIRGFIIEANRLSERVQTSKSLEKVGEEKETLKQEIKDYRIWRKSVRTWLMTNIPEMHSGFAVLTQKPITPYPGSKGKLKAAYIASLHDHIEFLARLAGRGSARRRRSPAQTASGGVLIST